MGIPMGIPIRTAALEFYVLIAIIGQPVTFYIYSIGGILSGYFVRDFFHTVDSVSICGNGFGVALFGVDFKSTKGKTYLLKLAAFLADFTT